ncbi:MAG TPA: hypothetical protein VII59_07325 [Streptosporangiaceae bacterium]
MVTVEGWVPQSAGAVWDRAGWPGSHGSMMSANAAAATDALVEAVLVAAVLAGAIAGGLALPVDEELLQPAARPTRAVSTAARADTAPMAVFIVRIMLLRLVPSLAVFDARSHSGEPRAHPREVLGFGA